jgi:hypothetical protein
MFDGAHPIGVNAWPCFSTTNPAMSVVMEEIWIIGVGHFGHIAYQRLSQAAKDRHFVMVDPVEQNLLKCRGPAATLRICNGVHFLVSHLRAGLRPDWIIPALPLHLAAEWLLSDVGPQKMRRIPIPGELDNMVPNPFRSPEGNLYVSHANFRCPADCEEPSDICTVTRKIRKQNMFELLGDLEIEPFTALTIRSHQLGPGVGGYRPEQLLELKVTVGRTLGPILLCTACRCHGVITGLEHL